MTEFPAPLTPADCDLRDFPFMPLDVLRLRDSDIVALLDAEAFRASVIAWCVSWHQVPAASLPDDDAVLCRLLGYGRDVAGWRRIREAGGLHGWISCADGRLYHAVVAEKAREAWERKLSQRERSRKGNAARWGARDDSQKDSHKDASAIPQGSPKESLAIPRDRDRDRDINPPTPQGVGGRADASHPGRGVHLAPSLRPAPGVSKVEPIYRWQEEIAGWKPKAVYEKVMLGMGVGNLRFPDLPGVIEELLGEGCHPDLLHQTAIAFKREGKVGTSRNAGLYRAWVRARREGVAPPGQRAQA